MNTDLYEVFVTPRPARVDFCDHCVDPASLVPFTTVPLRSLTAGQIEVYWLKSGTIGDEEFIRYLLPRFLELVRAGEIVDADYYLRLATAAPRTPGEREAVAAYLRDLWTAGLTGQPRIEVREVVERLAETHDDVTPFLTELEQVPALLADYVYSLVMAEKRPSYAEAWLLSDGPLTALENAALNLPDAGGVYSTAHLLLEGPRVR